MKKKLTQTNLTNRLQSFNQGLQSLESLSGFTAQPEQKKEKKERTDGFCCIQVVMFASVYKKIQVYALQTDQKVKDIIKEIVTDIPSDKDVTVYLFSPYLPEPTEEDSVKHVGRPKKKDDSKVFQITIDYGSLNKLYDIVRTCYFYTPEGTLIKGQIKHLLNSAMIHFLDQHK